MRRFLWIAGLLLLAFVAANLIAAHLQSDCGLPGVLQLAGCADDISRVGFPWVFWETGGFAARERLDLGALGLDVGLALLVSLGAAWGLRRPPQPPGKLR